MLRPSLFFRTRSPERDSRTDATRREAVAAVIERQRNDARRELEGLSSRMQAAYTKAATLLEASADFAQRSREEEEAIGAFEASAEAARKRIIMLQSEIGLFDALLARVKAGPLPGTSIEQDEGTPK